MVEGCLFALTNLCRNTMINQDLIDQNNSILSIIDSIQIHYLIPETVEIGLKCLVSTIENNTENSINNIYNINKLKELNYEKKISFYFTHHKTDYDIVKICCELLLQIYYHDNNDEKILLLVNSNQLTEDKKHANPTGRYLEIYEAWGIANFIE